MGPPSNLDLSAFHHINPAVFLPPDSGRLSWTLDSPNKFMLCNSFTGQTSAVVRKVRGSNPQQLATSQLFFKKSCVA